MSPLVGFTVLPVNNLGNKTGNTFQLTYNRALPIEIVFYRRTLNELKRHQNSEPRVPKIVTR